MLVEPMTLYTSPPKCGCGAGCAGPTARRGLLAARAFSRAAARAPATFNDGGILICATR